ncbi:hypothetical protein LTR50_006079 [Elasticomyces elasticus]|nr:hypothetical protein LTR50_006079 [Elasticomyces elasticus]
MVKILPKNTAYRTTDKGTVIRAAFYRDFEDLIEAAYKESVVAGSLALEDDDLIVYLRKELLNVATIPDPAALQNDADLFSLGVDSLQSIRLRSKILGNIDVGGKKISQNFVFEYPSLKAMAKELTRLRLGNMCKERPTLEQRMTTLIEKYSKFEKHVATSCNAVEGEHIVVTGATGSLGAHIVARLASFKNVSKVYCLVRSPFTESAQQRVRSSLEMRCIYHTLSAGSRKKLVCLPADFAHAQLGLDDGTYQTIASKLTGLIHCAWSVNFNLALESFEKDSIAGTRHLIDLCLKARSPSPARFSFCSSVSAVAATPGEIAPETLPPSLLHAQNMGYAQSKLVTEHIVNRAAKQTGIAARVLRVGQIVGDTRHGVWNATEAIPMIFQTAQTIGALPTLDKSPSWTPVDVVADSVIEMSMSEEGNDVMNLVNPQLFHWTRDLLPLLRQAGLEFDELPQQEWVARLRSSDPDPKTNPPIKLLEFFASKYGHNEKRRKLTYDSRKAERCAPSLRNAGVLDAGLATKFVNFFRTKCWNQDARPAAKQAVIVLSGPCDRLYTTGALAIDVTWLALRRAYRDELRLLDKLGDNTKVVLLLLSSDEEELKQRMALRPVYETGDAKIADGDIRDSKDWETNVVLVDGDRPKEVILSEVVDIVREITRI